MHVLLIAEYDVANLYLWASLSDGSRIPLAHDDSRGVSLRPLRPHSLGSAHVSHVSCTAGSSPWEIGWSLSCDRVVVASHGGSSFNQVVSFPRTNATGNGSSPCTLTLIDSGGDGWAGATWAGFGQSNLSLASGSSTEITFLASVPTEPPHFQLAVPYNASSGVGGAFEAGWGACGTAVVTDIIEAEVEISPPASISLSAVFTLMPGAEAMPTALATPGTAAAADPFLLPSSVMLEPFVTFAAGHSRSLSSDARLHLEVLTPDCATASTSPASLSILPNASCIEVVVFASLPLLTEIAGVASVNTTLRLAVSDVATLSLSRDACPPNPTKPDILRPIGCSGAYQTSQLRATATLRTGEALDVTRFSTWSSSDESVLRCHCLNNCAPSYQKFIRSGVYKTIRTEPYHAVPLAPGTATVLAYFMFPRHGANQTFQVSDLPANVSSIAVAISDSLAESYGFGRFATRTSVWFDDGSAVVAMEDFTCASTDDDDTFVLGARLVSPAHAWLPPADIATGGLGMQGGAPIVALSSSDTAAVTLAASVAGGNRYVVVTTLANRHAPINITAAATCGGPSVQGSATFVANLAPDFLDVDLGSSPTPPKATSRKPSHAPPGLQFVQSGGLLQVGVYANVAGVRLINFQVILELLTTCNCLPLTLTTHHLPLIILSRWSSTSTPTTFSPKASPTWTGRRLSRRSTTLLTKRSSSAAISTRRRRAWIHTATGWIHTIAAAIS